MSENQVDQAYLYLHHPPNYETPPPLQMNYVSHTSVTSVGGYFHSNSLANQAVEESFAMLEVREHDRSMIENFVRENDQELDTAKKNRRTGSNISDTKIALMTISELNNDLKLLNSELKKNEDMPQAEWETKITEIEHKRNQISHTLNKLNDEQFIKHLKRCIDKRKKKRLQKKKQKATRKIEALAVVKKRMQLHAKADAWITDKQAIIEKEKQELAMRKDADVVLAEVRGRRNDARKCLALLEELRNLRRIRVNIARARGEYSSTAADETFANIIDRLVTQWTAMDREYSIEERGLKLMLKTDSEEKIEKQKKTIFNDWEQTLFGKKLSTVDIVQKNVPVFIVIRTAWDKYISYDDQGSPIPIGWVIPGPPTSTAWQHYLTKE